MIISETAMIQVVSSNRTAERNVSDPMIRIVPWEGVTGGNMWVTACSDTYGYHADSDQTCEYHTGTITYGDVRAGRTPWIDVGYHNKTVAESEAREEWQYGPQKVNDVQAEKIFQDIHTEAVEQYPGDAPMCIGEQFVWRVAIGMIAVRIACGEEEDAVKPLVARYVTEVLPNVREVFKEDPHDPAHPANKEDIDPIYRQVTSGMRRRNPAYGIKEVEVPITPETRHIATQRRIRMIEQVIEWFNNPTDVPEVESPRFDRSKVPFHFGAPKKETG